MKLQGNKAPSDVPKRAILNMCQLRRLECSYEMGHSNNTANEVKYVGLTGTLQIEIAKCLPSELASIHLIINRHCCLLFRVSSCSP